MIKKVRGVAVRVSDQDRALEFYVDKLGFRKKVDVQSSDGYRMLDLEIPGAETWLAINRQVSSVETAPYIIFEADDLLATCEDLRLRGVEFIEAPTMQSWGGYLAVFVDPDGNRFILVEAGPPKALEHSRGPE